MSKIESDGLNKLDINWLAREKLIQSQRSIHQSISWTHRPSGNTNSINIESNLLDGQSCMRLSYTLTDNFDGTKTDVDYRVPITTTPCFFGGNRFWFVCPLVSSGKYCGKRVAKLYRVGNYFGCRHCHKLTYQSRNLSGFWKVIGTVVSQPDIDEMWSHMRSKSYRGKPTKKFKRYLKLQRRSNSQMELAEVMLYA